MAEIDPELQELFDDADFLDEEMDSIHWVDTRETSGDSSDEKKPVVRSRTPKE